MPDDLIAPRPVTLSRLNPASVLAVAVVTPVVAVGVFYLFTAFSELPFELLFWVALVAAVELLPAPAWGGVEVSLGFPLLTAVAIIYSPGAAALAAFAGSFDPRELRGEVTALKAAFNRSQIALAVLSASAVFHSLSSVQQPLLRVIPSALVASVVDYAINISLVSLLVSLVYRLPVQTVVRQLSRGQEFLISYVGLGVLGAVLAKLDSIPEVGFWSVITVLAPLLFARSMFYRSHALEEAHKELQEREQILKQLSNAMAEERQDERSQIAGYLHDDLAQILFRLSIQVDVAKRLLEKGEVDNTLEQLEKIKQSKQDTSDRIRALIRDLHRSPLGPKGLAEALDSFTEEIGRDAGVIFHTDVHDIALPAPIALLIYHIAREGVTNALKHAGASDVWITVREDGEWIELLLRDNGVGFDTQAPGPEGHYGMAMIRERSQVGGGTLEVRSAPGEGTTITVRFPSSLLQQQPSAEDGPSATAGAEPDRGSPDKTGATGTAPKAQDSSETVRA